MPGARRPSVKHLSKGSDMPKKIVVAGSLTSPSSKARNQAIAVARNAGNCLVFGVVGGDRQALEDELLAEGVDISLLPKNGGSLDAGSVEFPEDMAFLVIQNELPEDTNVELERAARGVGAGVILNAAPARPFGAKAAGLADILVVDRSGAAKLAGQAVEDRASAVEAARALASLSNKVVVTLGYEGLVHLRAGGRAEYQPPFRAEPVSDDGADDFFVGALATQLAAGSEFEAAIHYAQAAYAAFVSAHVDKRHMIRPVQIRAKLGEDEL